MKGRGHGQRANRSLGRVGHDIDIIPRHWPQMLDANLPVLVLLVTGQLATPIPGLVGTHACMRRRSPPQCIGQRKLGYERVLLRDIDFADFRLDAILPPVERAFDLVVHIIINVKLFGARFVPRPLPRGDAHIHTRPLRSNGRV